jgi:hypothetical protein
MMDENDFQKSGSLIERGIYNPQIKQRRKWQKKSQQRLKQKKNGKAKRKDQVPEFV